MTNDAERDLTFIIPASATSCENWDDSFSWDGKKYHREDHSIKRTKWKQWVLITGARGEDGSGTRSRDSVCVCVCRMCVLSSLDSGLEALLLRVKMKLSVWPFRLAVPSCSWFCETIFAAQFVLNCMFGLCTSPLDFDAPHWQPHTEEISILSRKWSTSADLYCLRSGTFWDCLLLALL